VDKLGVFLCQYHPTRGHPPCSCCLSRSWKPLTHSLKAWTTQPPPVTSVTTHPPLTGIVPVPTESLQRANFYPTSLSHHTSLSLLLCNAPLSAIGLLPYLSSPIPHSSAQVHLDSYRTCYPYVRLTHRPDDGGSMHPEISVNFNVTTRHYIPEDSKFHTCCHKNLKSHC
jgi:hypothetical protein